jgi:hypothetical protein
VIREVAGSNPVSHPCREAKCGPLGRCRGSTVVLQVVIAKRRSPSRARASRPLGIPRCELAKRLLGVRARLGGVDDELLVGLGVGGERVPVEYDFALAGKAVAAGAASLDGDVRWPSAPRGRGRGRSKWRTIGPAGRPARGRPPCDVGFRSGPGARGASGW